MLIGGSVVYHEGSFTRVDRRSVLEDIRQSLNRPESDAETGQRRLSFDLLGPVGDFYKDWL